MPIYSPKLNIIAGSNISVTNTTDSSTIAVANVGSANGIASLDADQKIPTSQIPSSAVTNFRNILINGHFQLAQRGTNITGITISGYYSADRWRTDIAGTVGTWTQSIATDTPSGTEFRTSLKMTCTTANGTLNAGDKLVIQQRVEGQNLLGSLKGTSNAKQITLSFWVKAGVANQTFIAELHDNDNGFFVSQSYTTAATANTWEKKILTFPAHTSGSFDNDANFSLAVNFWLTAGSDFTGGGSLQTTWGAGTNTRAVGQTNLSSGNVAATNFWQITGVQLEIGNAATDFELLPAELTRYRAYRYYYELGRHVTGLGNTSLMGMWYQSASQVETVFIYPTPMRAAPTGISSRVTNCMAVYAGLSTDFLDGVYFTQLTPINCLVFEGAVADGGGGTANGTTGYPGRLFIPSAAATGTLLAFDAEL